MDTQHREIVQKAWGREEILINTDYCGKVLYLEPQHQCSLHRHLKKDETFYIIKGHIEEQLYEEWHPLGPGASIQIPPGEWHRFRNKSQETAVIMEISTHHSDDDIERQNFSGRLI